MVSKGVSLRGELEANRCVTPEQFSAENEERETEGCETESDKVKGMNLYREETGKRRGARKEEQSHVYLCVKNREKERERERGEEGRGEGKDERLREQWSNERRGKMVGYPVEYVW